MIRSTMKTAAAAAILALAMPHTAHAAVLTGAGSLVGGNPIPIPAVNYSGAGPQVLGPITWSSNQANSLYGWTGGYSFGNGTVAPGGSPLTALNAMYDTATGGPAIMSLTFDNPVSGFLAEVFWTDGYSNLHSAYMAVYDVNNNLIYNTEYSVNDNRYYYWAFNNNGAYSGMKPGYYGFSYTSSIIKTVRFGGGQIGFRNASWTGAAFTVGAVPEPQSWAMMIGGFLLIGSAIRTRRRMRYALIPA